MRSSLLLAMLSISSAGLLMGCDNDKPIKTEPTVTTPPVIEPETQPTTMPGDDASSGTTSGGDAMSS